MTNWYCPLPFKHAFVTSNGISACCQTPQQPVDLSQWTNSKYLKDFQEQILSGQPPKECNGCVSQEKITGKSLRTDSLQDYDHQRFTDSNIDFVDYRANNICNFKCRSCEPRFSHGIANETKNNLVLQKFHEVVNQKVVSVTDTNIEWIRQNLPQIKRLMLTGGEPTLIPEIRVMVERIVYDKLDVHVMITTNSSFENDFWCELTRLHDNVHWTVSLDAVGPAAEIIRHGTNWPLVERNVRWLATNAASMNVNTVISSLNILHLKPLLQFVKEIQKESIFPRGCHGNQGIRHQFTVILPPHRLSAANLPNTLKEHAISHITECLDMDLDQEQTQTLQGVLNQLHETKFDASMWEHNETFNNELDKIRGQNHLDLYEKETFINSKRRTYGNPIKLGTARSV
jgi:molybdenum cofactor biosynthesis enzyme MoaA